MMTTTRFSARRVPAFEYVHVVATSVLLLGAFTCHSAAQSARPRFERTVCWVDGEWARNVGRS